MFGINDLEPPFNIEVIPLGEVTTSIENTLSSTSQIKVYPNPFYLETTFEIQLDAASTFQFQVFDINGREVKFETLQLNEGINLIPFNGSNLTKGFYTYRFSNLRGYITGKMIIAK